MLEMIADALREAWQNFLGGVALFLPRVLAMLSILIVGVVSAWVLGTITRRVLGWIRFNTFADRIGWGEMLRRSGLPPADELSGRVVFWVVCVGFVLSGLQALGVAGLDTVVVDFMHYVPRVVVALAIVGVGFGIATFAWRATLLAAVNASMPWARALSELVRFLILALAVAMALEQIAVAHSVVLTAFAITFGALMLGMAIAIGIGGAGIVRRILEERLGGRGPHDQDPSAHL